MMLIIPPGGFLCEGVAKLPQAASSGPHAHSKAEPKPPKGKIEIGAALYINS